MRNSSLLSRPPFSIFSSSHSKVLFWVAAALRRDAGGHDAPPGKLCIYAGLLIMDGKRQDVSSARLLLHLHHLLLLTPPSFIFIHSLSYTGAEEPMFRLSYR